VDGVRMGVDSGDIASAIGSLERGGSGSVIPTTVWYVTLSRETRTGGV
jgi:hypothetical protein